MSLFRQSTIDCMRHMRCNYSSIICSSRFFWPSGGYTNSFGWFACLLLFSAWCKDWKTKQLIFMPNNTNHVDPHKMHIWHADRRRQRAAESTLKYFCRYSTVGVQEVEIYWVHKMGHNSWLGQSLYTADCGLLDHYLFINSSTTSTALAW